MVKAYPNYMKRHLDSTRVINLETYLEPIQTLTQLFPVHPFCTPFRGQRKDAFETNGLRWSFFRQQSTAFQKQPQEVYCEKKMFLKISHFQRKAPLLESLFNKVAGLHACNFLKKALQQKCFPVKFANFSNEYLF